MLIMVCYGNTKQRVSSFITPCPDINNVYTTAPQKRQNFPDLATYNTGGCFLKPWPKANLTPDIFI